MHLWGTSASTWATSAIRHPEATESKSLRELLRKAMLMKKRGWKRTAHMCCGKDLCKTRIRVVQRRLRLRAGRKREFPPQRTQELKRSKLLFFALFALFAP